METDEQLAELIQEAVDGIVDEIFAGQSNTPKRLTDYRGSEGETWEEEEAKRNREQDMETKMLSAGAHLEKVFGSAARSFRSGAMVDIKIPYRAKVSIEKKDSFPHMFFKVKILKTTRDIAEKDFGVGVGAPGNIARYIKKVQKVLEKEEEKRSRNENY